MLDDRRALGPYGKFLGSICKGCPGTLCKRCLGTGQILKGGSLFAFERPEPEGVVLRDSPHFRFSYFPFLSNPAGPKFGVNPGTWRIPSTLPARCSLIAAPSLCVVEWRNLPPLRGCWIFG